MIRNLKALGLALVAIFAMSAMAASAASAAPKFTVEGGGAATLDISEIIEGNDTNALTTPAWGRTVHCPGTTYTGHEINSKVNGIPNNATTATITPTYKKCTVSGGLFATVTTNGCDFVFHVLETEPAGTYPVTADVVCPEASKGIHVTVYSNEAHTSTLCTIEVTGGALNQGLKGAHVINEGAKEGTKDDLRVTGTFEGIHAERTGLCIFDGKGTTTNEAIFDLDVTVKGTTAGGAQLGVTVSD